MAANKYVNAINVNISPFTNRYSVWDTNKIIATIAIILKSAALKRKILPLK